MLRLQAAVLLGMRGDNGGLLYRHFSSFSSKYNPAADLLVQALLPWPWRRAEPARGQGKAGAQRPWAWQGAHGDASPSPKQKVWGRPGGARGPAAPRHAPPSHLAQNCRFLPFFCPVSPPPGGSWALSRLRTPHAAVRANNNARPLLANSIKALRAYLSPGNLSRVTLISNLLQPPPLPSVLCHLAGGCWPQWPWPWPWPPGAPGTSPAGRRAGDAGSAWVTRLPLAPRGSHPCVERCRVSVPRGSAPANGDPAAAAATRHWREPKSVISRARATRI